MQSFEYELKKSKGRYLRIQIKPGGIMEVFKPSPMPMFLVNRFLKKKEDWIKEKIEKQKNKKAVGRKVDKRTTRKDYLSNKEEARKLVHAKLNYWMKYYQENYSIKFVWKKVAIKNLSTRWGSCSSHKNLNFSYNIISLSNEAQDYLIVHELSHLIHMNHSKNFWGLVGLGVPNYKKLRKELKGFQKDIE